MLFYGLLSHNYIWENIWIEFITCQLSSSGWQFNLPNVASTMFWIILYVWMYLIFSFLCIQLGIKLQTNMKSRCAVIGHYQLGWFIRFPVRMGSKPQHLQVQVYLVNVSRLTKQPIPHLFIHSYAYRLVTKMNGHTPQLNFVLAEKVQDDMLQMRYYYIANNI